MVFGMIKSVLSSTINIKHIKEGSIVHCSFIGGIGKHSGIVVSANSNSFEIAEVYNGDTACIRKISHKDFTSGVRASPIYVAYNDKNQCIADYSFASNARYYLNTKLDYEIFKKNCHMFTAMCLGIENSNTKRLQMNLKENGIGGGINALLNGFVKEAVAVTAGVKAIEQAIDYYSDFEVIEDGIRNRFGSVEWLKITE